MAKPLAPMRFCIPAVLPAIFPALLAALSLAAATAPPSLAESPEIRFEAGADLLVVDRGAIASAEIPAGYTAYISGAQDVVPLLLRFTPEIATRLEALTAAHVGETIFILIDGALVSQPMVREPIDTGGVIITNLDRAVAEGILATIGPPPAAGQ